MKKQGKKNNVKNNKSYKKKIYYLNQNLSIEEVPHIKCEDNKLQNQIKIDLVKTKSSLSDVKATLNNKQKIIKTQNNKIQKIKVFHNMIYRILINSIVLFISNTWDIFQTRISF